MRSSLRQKQILECSRKVFASRGYHGTAVSDIIREARVARGTFYRHFKDKRDVFDKLIDGFFASLELDIRRVVVAPGAPPVIDQMLGNVTRILHTLFEHSDLTRILIREAVGIDKEFDTKIDEFYGRILSLIQLSLLHGQEMGIVRKCDTQLAAMVVLGSVRQVLDTYLGQRRTPPNPIKVGRELLDLVAGGLFAPGHARRS